MLKKILLSVIFLFLLLDVSAYTVSSPQYTQPGFNSFSYLNGQGISFGNNFTENQCGQGGDLILQIAPLGCTPTVVRSDLLEEQNVAVFCPLAATKINPLVNIEAIQYMDIGFSPQVKRPDQVSGVGFHPAQAALKRSSSTLLNSPVLNNVGYAVIVLKKQSNESAMPDFVEGNLTASIRYDIKTAFGIGQVDYTVPVLNDNDFSEQYKRYGFWNGKGYIRVTDVDSAGASIALYSDSTQRISSFTLKKGASSNEVSIPGFYCNARMTVRLVDIKNPDTVARLRVDGEVVEVEKGQSFADNKCQVLTLEKNGLDQRVTIRCDTDSGKESFGLALSPSVNINADGQDLVKTVGDQVYSLNGKNYFLVYIKPFDKDSFFTRLDKATSNDKDKIYLYETTNSELDPVSLDTLAKTIPVKSRIAEQVPLVDNSFKVEGGRIIPIQMGIPYKIDDKAITFTSYSGGNNKVTDNPSSNLASALRDYDRIVNTYGSEKTNDNQNYGEVALYQSILLSSGLQENNKVTELCSEFRKLYPTSSLLGDLQNKCDNILVLSNGKASSRAISVNGAVRDMTLEGLIDPDLEDYSAELKVTGIGGPIILSKDVYDDDIIRLELVKLEDEKATIKVSVPDTTKTTGLKRNIEKTIVLSRGSFENVGTKTITLTNINLKKVAKLSIIPKIDDTRSEANFSFKIGIEKRAINLAPEEINQKIANLNQSIEKWDEISANLGKVVKGFKAACLTTGTILTVKNFISDANGGAIARQDVMRAEGGYVDKCKSEISGTKEGLDECLLRHNADIERDVKKLESIISSQKAITEDNSKTEIPAIAQSLPNEIVNPNKPSEKIDVNALKSGLNSDTLRLSEARDIETWSSVLNSGASPELTKIAQQNLYNKLKSVEGTVQAATSKNTWAGELKVSPSDIDLLSTKDSKERAYRGLTASQVGLNGAGTSPVAVIQSTTGGKYIVLLDGSAGNKNYPIARDSQGLIVYNDKKEKLTQDKIPDDLKKSHFVKYDSASYKNKFLDPEVKYFETDPYKGLPAQVPFNLNDGWYASMKQTLPGAIAGVAGMGGTRTYDDSGRPASFMICNVGENGKAEAANGYGDDTCRNFNPGNGEIYGAFPGLAEGETDRLVKEAMGAIEDAGRQYKAGVREVTIAGKKIKVGNPAVNTPDIQCSDFMSPSDCNLLFNMCDPVICPSSRCDLGGSYPVDNVIQSGIVGSIALCLPNAPEIKVPICLTGVEAGVDGFVSVMKNYRDCLNENLETGKTVGICDEINSVYMCEFMWRQSVPVAKLAIPKILESLTGQGSKGGGEYLGISSAWSNAEKSIDYMVNYYGAESYKAFQARTTDEAGSSICKAFASARYPNSGGWLDALLEPDSPDQYHGWFSEIPYSTATVPATSQYKVFYHIYAGKDQGAYFQVYMKAPEGSSFFTSNPRIVVDSGYIKQGNYASQTKDFVAPTGYKEMCISVNGHDECGFQKVSTSFALNYVEDQYIKEQATAQVTTESECVSGSPSVFSLAQPNVQEGIDEALNPALYNHGVIRVCSTASPGKGTDSLWSDPAKARWISVGVCGDAKLQCWLDKESVKDVVKDIDTQNDILDSKINNALNVLKQEGNYISDFGAELKKIDPMTPQEKISYIDEELIRKAFEGKNKANLLLIRGSAYGDLAFLDYVKIVAQQTESYVRADTNITPGTTPVGTTNDVKTTPKTNSLIFELQDGSLTSNPYFYFDSDKTSWAYSKDNKEWIIPSSIFKSGTGWKDDLIKSLSGKNYIDGQALLVKKTNELSSGPGAVLKTKNVAYDGDDKIFTLTSIPNYPSSVSLKFNSVSGKWEILVEKVWSQLSEGLFAAHKDSLPQGNAKTFLISLKDKNLDEGSAIIMQEANFILLGIESAPIGVDINDEDEGIMTTSDVVDEEDRSDVDYSFTSRTRASVTQIIIQAKDNELGGRKCNCGADCSTYANLIDEASKNVGIPDSLLLLSLMMQESSCNAKEESSSSVGLMQTNLDNCGSYGLPSNKDECKNLLLTDPKVSIYAGARELVDKYNQFKGGKEFTGACTNDYKGVKYYNWEAALRGYNGWGCNPTYPEQDKYVDEVMSRYELLSAKA